MALTKVNDRMIDGAPINALDYGADPTGTSDSYAAIQAAIDAVEATGKPGVVSIPSGTYLCNTGLTVDASLVSIKGDNCFIKFENIGVNDFAITEISKNYLRWNGDFRWLDKTVQIEGGNKAAVIDLLLKYAANWKNYKSPNGLADYGGINNLLECVSTYIHEVASLNAANVFNIRTVAEFCELTGKQNLIDKLLKEADELIPQLNKLYVDGKGFWCARFPDGRLVEVRHCYDFITILNTIPNDLTSKQKSEMVEFFKRELQSPTWMRALSAGDDNATFSVRPDHQWNGAYPAWPAQAVTALFKAGDVELALKWLKGLAKSANQGPLGQAHFVESAIEPDSGGATKAPPDMPYITDWTVSSSGSWTNNIIESIFGINATLNKGINSNPQFGSFDGKAELKNIFYQGRYYHANSERL